MTVALPEWCTPHIVRVRDKVSGGGMGPSHAAARDVAAFAEDEQKLVTGPGGEQMVSTAQVVVNFDEQIPIGSLVTVWPGLTGEREAKVIAIGRHQHPTLPSYQTLSLA